MNNDEPPGFPDGYFDDKTEYHVERIHISLQVLHGFTDRVKRSERDRDGSRNFKAQERIHEIQDAVSMIDSLQLYRETRVTVRQYKNALKLLMAYCSDRNSPLYRELHTTYIDMTYIPNHIIICIQ